MMIRLFMMIIFLTGYCFSSGFSIDAFHALKADLVLRYEHPFNQQQSFLFGYNSMNLNDDVYTSNFDVAYRRYTSNTIESGVFYSFGVRYGLTKMDGTSSGVNSEQDRLIMTFFDWGLKTKLLDHFYHTMHIELGYVIAYSDLVDIDDLLGLQSNIYFGYGYLF